MVSSKYSKSLMLSSKSAQFHLNSGLSRIIMSFQGRRDVCMLVAGFSDCITRSQVPLLAQTRYLLMKNNLFQLNIDVVSHFMCITREVQVYFVICISADNQGGRRRNIVGVYFNIYRLSVTQQTKWKIRTVKRA